METKCLALGSQTKPDSLNQEDSIRTQRETENGSALLLRESEDNRHTHVFSVGSITSGWLFNPVSFLS